MTFPTPLRELTGLSIPLYRLSLSKSVSEHIMANYKGMQRAKDMPKYINE
jgi:hypothetical protein